MKRRVAAALLVMCAGLAGVAGVRSVWSGNQVMFKSGLGEEFISAPATDPPVRVSEQIVTKLVSLTGVVGEMKEVSGVVRSTTIADVMLAIDEIHKDNIHQTAQVTFIESEGVLRVAGNQEEVATIESLIRMMRDHRAQMRAEEHERSVRDAQRQFAIAAAQRVVDAATQRETALRYVATTARNESVPATMQAWYDAAAEDAAHLRAEAVARLEASASQLSALPPLLTLPSFPEIPEGFEQQLAAKNHRQLVDQLQARMELLEKAVAERDGLLAQRDSVIANHQTMIAQRDQLLQERDSALRSVNHSLAQHASTIEEHARILRDRERSLADISYHLEQARRNDHRDRSRLDDLAREIEREKRARRDAEQRAADLQRKLDRYIPGQPSQQPPDPHNGQMGPFPKK